MRFSGALLILSVLIYSTAVSSTSSRGSGEIKCSIGSLNLCNSLSDVESYGVGTFTPDQMSCSTCNMLMLIMKKKFESTTKEDMIDGVLHECNSLSILSETCANMVFNYFDYFYNFLKHQLQSNKICAISGICVGTDWKQELESVSFQVQNDEFYCEECLKITKYIQHSLTKGTETQFKAHLTDLCHSMPILKHECARFVDQYSHAAYDMLKSMKLDVLCSLTGVCHKKRNENKDKELQLISNNVARQSKNCGFCKGIIKTLKEMVREQYDISAILKVVCDDLKGQNLIDKCHKMIDNHTALIIELVSKNASRHEICRKLNMCLLLNEESNFDLEMPQPLSEVYRGKKHKKIKESFECIICKRAIHEYLTIDHNANKDEIKNAMEKACHKLGLLHHKCDKFMSKYSDGIVDLILKIETPYFICKTIELCRSEEDYEMELNLSSEQEQFDESICTYLKEYMRENNQLEGSTPSVNSALGALCRMILSSIKRVFDTQNKREKIVDAVVLICNIWPGFIQIPCHTVVQHFGIAFLQAINELSPHYVCHFLDPRAGQTVIEDLNNAFNEYLQKSCDFSTS